MLFGCTNYVVLFSLPARYNSLLLYGKSLWGCTGFDGVAEARKAGGGFSLASFKNVKLQVIADKTELVAA